MRSASNIKNNRRSNNRNLWYGVINFIYPIDKNQIAETLYEFIRLGLKLKNR